MIAPSTATCLLLWRSFLLPALITAFSVNLALGSFKLMHYGRWLLVVERGARVDKVYLVEWDFWVLPNESDRAALIRIRVCVS